MVHYELYYEKGLKMRLEDLADSEIMIADFTGISVVSSEVERLLFDPANQENILAEAMTAAEYQVYFGVRLERPKPEYHENGTPKAGFDYWITDTGERLDFLFTMYGEDITKSNQFFAFNDKAWEGKVNTIQEHFAKADVVPMDLRYITDRQNGIKLINYVLSLPKHQQKKVVLIWGDKQP